ncbi:hypothetical protein [Alkalihalobacillus sp. LMS39]|uniref:hypothetical protein n=1 Tax=Alkalihalobacillus sp. LMS39 TaxID=2924032 RepID=UPI001FB420FD|nr:hypothetical protein [Alkalihalobacillus sp. LMS39]UOE96213.1 hypothetical protein MM271_11680 [Alkalihalobacillus sp. LMS39]
MLQKLLKIGLLAFVLFSFIPSQVQAEGQIHVETNIGFDNKVKQYQGFPVEVTLTNKGEDISGELVIQVSPGYHSNNGSIITQVELPANSEKTIQLTVPGLGDSYYYNNQNFEHIKFYEGSWQTGKEVSLTGQTKLSPRILSDDEIVFGLLTSHPDAFNFIKSLKGPWENQHSTMPIDDKHIPTNPMGLSMFSAIVVDQYAVADLSAEQQSAIASWVSLGGQLYVTADLSADQKLGNLSRLLPMASDLKSETIDTEFFETVSEEEYPNKQVEVVIGTLHEDAVIIQKTDDEIPLITSRSYGSGEIIQLSFSPSAQTFASWDGATKYWTNAFMQQQSNNHYYYESIYDRLGWGFASIANLFPSSFLPFSLLVGVMVVYILIIFPVLFFILKKMDKREHSWWIIPALSLIICLSIFGFGGKDRIAQPQLNEITLLQIDEQGMGQGYGSVAFLSNKSGNYAMTVGTGDFLAFPISMSHNMGSSVSTAGIRNQGDQVDFLFKDVEYWSIRNVTGPLSNIETGQLDTDLQLSNKKITGTITNNTQFSFDELLFLSGRQEESLGAIAAGETLNVDIELKGSLLLAPSYRNVNYNSNQDIDDRRKEELLNQMIEFSLFERGKPSIVGLTNEEVLQTTLENSDPLVERLNVITQSVYVENLYDGPFELVTDDFAPYVYGTDHMGHYLESDLESGGRMVMASAGTYEFGYHVPEDLLDADFTQLEIKINNSPNFEYEIFISESDSYEPLDDKASFDDPKKYINEYGQMLIRVTKSDMPEQIPVPELSLKGDVKE